MVIQWKRLVNMSRVEGYGLVLETPNSRHLLKGGNRNSYIYESRTTARRICTLKNNELKRDSRNYYGKNKIKVVKLVESIA